MAERPPASHSRSRRDTLAHTRQGSARCSECQRDAHGRIARSSAARREFQHEHPCPSTGRQTGACPGYVVDHVVPLRRGGADEPSNMQWQTVDEAREKDRRE